MRPRLERGLIEVYTGKTKGKTTAALGLALRAVGHDFRVLMISFMKGAGYTGELFSSQRLHTNFRIMQFGRGCPYSAMIKEGKMKCKPACRLCFIHRGNVTEQDRETQRMALAAARESIEGDEYDIVILDEILNAIDYGLVDLEETLELLKRKPPLVEVVLTGRQAPSAIVEVAHLVTEMVQIKHPLEQGIRSRRGIEY
ncbi:MAG: cob(I)yrinic acid a,c-diamide adenosyltransferase [Firmicutes bacterium]|nr:cob(I)yrinic acid a,c-diamide adenosyltransferase [Bacillota bacterium]